MRRLEILRREPRRRWPLWTFCLALLAPCCTGAQHKGPARPTPPVADAAATPPTEGKVSFACEPVDAEIRVDGERVGTVAEINARGGLALSFGAHRFELAHPGHQTFRVELNIGEQPEVIRVKLQPLRPAQ